MSLFITLEGGEGSGKTSVIKVLEEKIKKELNLDVLSTREPGGIEISEQIRSVLLNKKNINMDKKTEALLFAAARRQHLVEKIIPHLNKKNSMVICDRFVDSSLVYQGMGRDIGFDNVFNINQFAIEGHMPNLTFLLDLDPKVGLERINKNSLREINRLDLEKIEFHQKVREGYLFLANKFSDRIKIIDASETIQQIADDIFNIIKKYLIGN